MRWSLCGGNQTTHSNWRIIDSGASEQEVMSAGIKLICRRFRSNFSLDVILESQQNMKPLTRNGRTSARLSQNIKWSILLTYQYQSDLYARLITNLINNYLNPRPAVEVLKVALTLTFDPTWTRTQWDWCSSVGSLHSNESRYQTETGIDHLLLIGQFRIRRTHTT